MKSKLLIMIAENIIAADVSNEKDITYLSFDGHRAMPINGRNSVDKAIGHIYDFYNVDNFESDTDVIIVYTKLSSDMINYFAASFVGCDTLGIIPIASILPVIIRNKNCVLPVEICFDKSVYEIGTESDIEATHMSVELNDLIFLFHTDADFYNSVTKDELNKLTEQITAMKNAELSYREQLIELSKKNNKYKNEIKEKDSEIKKLKSSLKYMEELAEAENARKKLLADRSIVYVDVPDDIWNALTDWNNEQEDHYYDAHLYLYKPTLTGEIVENNVVTYLMWSFGQLSNEVVERRKDDEYVNTLFRFPIGHFHLLSSLTNLDNKSKFVESPSDEKMEGFVVNRNIVEKYIDYDFVKLKHTIMANKTGKIFRLVNETDEIFEQNQAIAVIGNENDTREDIDKWLAEIGRSDLKCV